MKLSKPKRLMLNLIALNGSIEGKNIKIQSGGFLRSTWFYWHLSHLEDWGYIVSERVKRGQRIYQLTNKGSEKLREIRK